MYRIMIVDNEPLILAGVVSLLNWEEHQCKIVKKAANGRQALEQMEKLRPDIVITDIQMSDMDGISFLKAAAQKGYETCFIILTNLEEFSLLKEALRLGVVDYLMKAELNEEMLTEALERAKRRCNLVRRKMWISEDREIDEEKRIRNYFKHMLIHDTYIQPDKRLDAIIREHYPALLLMLISFDFRSNRISEGFTRADQKRAMNFAENIICEMVKGFFDRGCLLRKEENSFILILSLEEMGGYKEQVEAMSLKFRRVMKDYFEIPLFLVASQPTREADEVQELLYQAMSVVNDGDHDGFGRNVYYLEGCKENFSSSFNIIFLKKELTGIVRQNDRKGFFHIMNQIIQLFAQWKPSRSQAVNACSNLYYFILFLMEEKEEQKFPWLLDAARQLPHLPSMNAAIDWLEQFRDKVAEALEDYKESSKDKYTELVMEYVRQHYQEKITLSQISSLLNMSQGYISSTFKRQTGKNFSDYVMEVKIEKAKELIGTHQYMMYEVSDKLGFDTQYYFSTVFKKITGYTPKEYENLTIRKQRCNSVDPQ